MSIQHVSITDPNIHEPKGAASASAGQALFANGAGSTEWRSPSLGDIGDLNVEDIVDLQAALDAAADGDIIRADGAGGFTIAPPTPTSIGGMYDHNDATTAVTPIPLTVGGTMYQLTNDAAGPATLLGYGLPGVADIWDSVNNQFDWTQGGVIQVGDTIDIRVDLDVTVTNNNTEIRVIIELGTGELLDITDVTYKTAGTYNLTRLTHIYVGSTTTLNNPAKLHIISDLGGDSVVVNGWFTRILHRNQ